jgi:Flp pilus assembly protein TadG
MRMLRKLLRDDGGLAAIEFAFVGPPFLLMLLSIIELGIVLTTQATMDGATRAAARFIRTGQVNAAGNTIASFQAVLCGNMSMFLSTTSCQTNLIVSVVSSTAATFSATSIVFPTCAINSAAPPPPGACPFSPGAAGNLVGVQVTYERPFIVPWVGRLLSTASDSQHIKLQSTVVFRNEPF